MRVWRIENDDSWLLSAALWVFAHDRHGRHQDAERAGAVVAVERGDVEVDAVGAADREQGDVGCERGGRASLQTLYRAPSHRTSFRERRGAEDVGGPLGSAQSDSVASSSGASMMSGLLSPDCDDRSLIQEDDLVETT